MDYNSPGLASARRFVVLPWSVQPAWSSGATWTEASEVAPTFGDSFEFIGAKDFKRVELVCEVAEGSAVATVMLQVKLPSPPEAPPAPSETEVAAEPGGPRDTSLASESR